MKVLALGNIPSRLTPIRKATGCHVMEYSGKIDVGFLKNQLINFIVSYRYRHIIKKEVLRYLTKKIINLHISLLPWNRGSDPNLWSFLEDTPKGISIHNINNEGIDTGDIIAQKEFFFDEEVETLASTYKKLNDEIIELFKIKWPLIKEGDFPSSKQPKGGSSHMSSDKKKFEYLLAKSNYHSPVKELKGKALKSKNEF